MIEGTGRVPKTVPHLGQQVPGFLEMAGFVQTAEKVVPRRRRQARVSRRVDLGGGLSESSNRPVQVAHLAEELGFIQEDLGGPAGITLLPV